MPWQKYEKQMLILLRLLYDQCLGGLLEFISYIFDHERRHCLIFGQIFKETEIIDCLRIIFDNLKYVLDWILGYSGYFTYYVPSSFYISKRTESC